MSEPRRFEVGLAGDEAVILKKYVMYKPIDFFPRWYLEIIQPEFKAGCRVCFYDFDQAENFLLDQGYKRSSLFIGDYVDHDGTFIAWFFELQW